MNKESGYPTNHDRNNSDVSILNGWTSVCGEIDKENLKIEETLMISMSDGDNLMDHAAMWEIESDFVHFESVLNVFYGWLT